MRWLGTALLVLLTGCAHYGFADADGVGHNEDDSVVSVWTVATPADEGLDAARLTRALVGALEQRGVHARWHADIASSAVRCGVTQSEVDGVRQTLFARAEVRCRVGRSAAPLEEYAAVGRYTASTAPRLPALVESHARLQEAAALDALETVAEEIAMRSTD